MNRNDESVALDYEIMDYYLSNQSPRIISKIWINAQLIIDNWYLYTLEGFFMMIEKRIPELNDFIEFGIVKKKAYEIRESKKKEQHADSVLPRDFLPLSFRAEIDEVFPELVIVRNEFRKAFMNIPNGLEKTEAWLYPYALNANSNADIEALVYFASQDEFVVQANEIKEILRLEFCYKIGAEFLPVNTEEATIEKAKNGTLSLASMAKLFSEINYFPIGLICSDLEEEYITASFFRIVEWMELNEFDPWIDAYSQEISTIFQKGVGSIFSVYQLFFFCRSDLLLKRASSFGLEALLYGICIGDIDASKPWTQYWEAKEDSGIRSITVDYLPVASIIIFAWQRINPSNINATILDKALQLLNQSQLSSGAWPMTSRDTNGDILSTCLAMHALGAYKPGGYNRYLSAAKKWLLAQQNEVGCWVIRNLPALMVNILCIEAIRLADGNEKISYRIQENLFGRKNFGSTSVKTQNDCCIVFCEGNVTGVKNNCFDENCYTKIFTLEFPDITFCSIGSCSDIETNEKLFHVIKKVNPYHKIIRLIDRDDRSEEEIQELNGKGITVLSLRELESYLLEDEIIEKLCIVSGASDKIDEAKRIKTDAISESIIRGNPSDDLKSAAGVFFTKTKILLGLTKCGNNYISFLRDTMAPLLTPDTHTYLLLRKDIFDI